MSHGLGPPKADKNTSGEVIDWHEPLLGEFDPPMLAWVCGRLGDSGVVGGLLRAAFLHEGGSGFEFAPKAASKSAKTSVNQCQSKRQTISFKKEQKETLKSLDQ